MPLEERFGHAPVGACLSDVFQVEIASFDVDSSRSRELFFCKKFLVVLFFRTRRD